MATDEQVNQGAPLKSFNTLIAVYEVESQKTL